MADENENLIAEFRKLGVERPERWASSQINEGIPQLQRARVLYKFWGGVVSHSELGWVDEQRRRYAISARAIPGNGANGVTHVPAIDRILSAGVSLDDLTTVVREMQIATLFHICLMLDDSSTGPRAAAGTNFGVFEVDKNNTPIRPIEALHESVYAFNAEAISRRKDSGGRI